MEKLLMLFMSALLFINSAETKVVQFFVTCTLVVLVVFVFVNVITKNKEVSKEIKPKMKIKHTKSYIRNTVIEDIVLYDPVIITNDNEIESEILSQINTGISSKDDIIDKLNFILKFKDTSCFLEDNPQVLKFIFN